MSPIFPFKQLWKQFGLLTCVSTQSGLQEKRIVSALMRASINTTYLSKNTFLLGNRPFVRLPEKEKKTSCTISVLTWDKKQKHQTERHDILEVEFYFMIQCNRTSLNSPCCVWIRQHTITRAVELNAAQRCSVGITACRPAEAPTWDYLRCETLAGNPQGLIIARMINHTQWWRPAKIDLSVSNGPSHLAWL